MSSLPSLLVFERCRTSMILAALVLRRTTIVAKSEWKSIPWSRFPSRVDSRKLLYDILADCPELFIVRDRIMAAQESQADKSTQLQQILDEAQEVCARLHHWNESWGHHTYTEVLPPTTTPLIADTTGRSTLAWTSIFHFETLYEANVLTTYRATLILILRFIASVRIALGAVDENHVHQQEILDAGLFICRSVDFHLSQMWTELGAFNLLFPVRMAYDAVGREQSAIGLWLEKILDDISAGRRGLWKSAKSVLDIG